MEDRGPDGWIDACRAALGSCAHWLSPVTGGVLLLVVGLFYLILFKSLRHANEMLMPKLIEIEEAGPR